MPEVTSEEVGRRLFQIHKEKAVEAAIEKVRRKMGTDWQSLASSDIEVLKHMLGEAWVSIERPSWEKCSFTRLTRKDLETIIRIGKEVSNEEKAEKTAIDEISNLLTSLV